MRASTEIICPTWCLLLRQSLLVGSKASTASITANLMHTLGFHLLLNINTEKKQCLKV